MRTKIRNMIGLLFMIGLVLGNSNFTTPASAEDASSPSAIAEQPLDSQFQLNFQGKIGNDIGSVVTDGKDIVLAATSDHLLRSADGGKSFAAEALPAKASFVQAGAAKDRFFFWTYNTKTPKSFVSKDGAEWTELALSGPDGPLITRKAEWLRDRYAILASYAAGDETYVFTSADGNSWTQAGRIASGDIGQIVWNGTRYTALGGGYRYYGQPKLRNQVTIVPDAKNNEAAEMIVFTSDDLSAWTQQSGVSRDGYAYRFSVNGKSANNYPVRLLRQPQNGVIYLNDEYGNTLVSQDGVSFRVSQRTPALQKAQRLSQMFYNGSLYLLYAEYWRGEGGMLTSKDKIHWSERKIPNVPLSLQVVQTEHGFVGFGEGGLRTASANGFDWKVAQPAGPGQFLAQVIKQNGCYYAVGSEFLYSVPAILRSDDGATWTKVVGGDRYKSSAGGRDDVRSIAGNGTTLVAAANGYTYTSTNGKSWKKNKLPDAMNLVRIAWTGKAYVAIGLKDESDSAKVQSFLYRSSDGVHWAQAYSMKGRLADVAGHDGTVVAVGFKSGQAAAAVSRDLKNWAVKSFKLGQDNPNWEGLKSTSFDPDPDQTFTNVQWVNGQFVIAADDLYVSKDGTAWSKVGGGYADYVQQTPGFRANGRLLWTGEDYRYFRAGVIGRSADLRRWTFYRSDALYQLKDALWTTRDLMAVGEDGLLVRIDGK